MTPTPQPKALELADAMDGQTLAHVKHGVLIGFVPNARCMLAAAELRRQHAEIERLNQWADTFTDAHLKERQTGDALLKEIRAERDSLRAEVERLKQSSAEWEGRAVFAENDAAALRMLVERLRADAERLDWLSDVALSMDAVADPDNFTVVYFGTDPCKQAYGRTLRIAVDAAREAKSPQNNTTPSQ